MKLKYLITIIFILSVISPVQARGVPKVSISENTTEDCGLGFYVWGCYFHDSKEILINSDLNVQNFEYVFWHEVGHYFLDGEDLSQFNNDEEEAAYKFALTFIGSPSFEIFMSCYEISLDCSLPTQKEKDYFMRLIIN